MSTGLQTKDVDDAPATSPDNGHTNAGVIMNGQALANFAETDTSTLLDSLQTNGVGQVDPGFPKIDTLRPYTAETDSYMNGLETWDNSNATLDSLSNEMSIASELWSSDNLNSGFDPKQLGELDNGDVASIWWQNWYNLADKLDSVENMVDLDSTNGMNSTEAVNRIDMWNTT